ncbi:MAG: M24 family metallopeptidase, partial [Puniceicoccales bacterium]
DADLLHLGGFHAPDAFLAFMIGGKRFAVLSALELNRGEKESRFDEVLPLEEVIEESGTGGDLAGRILWLARKYGASRLCLPEDFPGRTAFELEEKGDLPLEFLDRPVCRDRLRKTVEEQECIRRVNGVVAGAFCEVERILAQSEIREGILFYEGEPLTSGIVRSAIAVHCLKAGCVASGTIVAGGDQACDPHEQGSGPLPANELIIVDIFPRDEETGFFGDMSRTYLKGSSSAEQRRLVETVKAAQTQAIERLAAGVDGKDIHDGVMEYFNENGFSTGRNERGYFGFFHGTGHGVGLEIHEEPRVSRVPYTLEAGMVTTVEPGLYYRGVGGCRIEDVLCLTEDGSIFLSDHPYDWEIA